MKQTRDLLVRLFSVSDLRDLCQAMRLEPDDFPQTLSAFARELVLHVDRLDLWASFAAAVREARPRADWSYLDVRLGVPAPLPQPQQLPSADNSGNVPEIAAAKTLRRHATALINILVSLPDWDAESDRRDFLVLNNLEAIEGGCNLRGSRRDAALSLLSAILRFRNSDPRFVADSLATLYETAAATGIFSALKQAELEREAATLRQR